MSSAGRVVAPISHTPLDTLLSSIGITSFHIQIIILCSIGYFASGAEFVLPLFIASDLKQHFSITDSSIALLSAVANGVAFFGGPIFGWLADTKGRRVAFMVTLGLVSVFGTAGALASTFWVLVGLRGVVALGLGGLQVVDFIVLNETLPDKEKGRLGQLVFLLGCLGVVYLASIDLALPYDAAVWGLDRWRLFTILAALPTIPALIMRICVSAETPKWLVAKGKTEEARVVLRKMAKDPNLKIPEDTMCTSQTKRTTIDAAVINLSVFTPIALLWFIQGFTYSGSMPFLGSFLLQSGVRRKLVFFLMAVSEVPGVLLSGYLSSKYGRELTLKIFWCLATVAGLIVTLAVALGNSSTGWGQAVVGAGCCIYYSFHIPVWGLLFVFTPELFPAQVRGRAGGWVSLVKTTPTVVAPFLGSWLIGLGRPGLFMGVWTGLIGAGAVVAVWFLKVPRGETWN